LTRVIVDNQVTIYTHPDCTYSEALKDELKEDGIDYKELDLSINPELWSKVVELTGGEKITPVMVTNDSVEVGFHGVG
tara:strand:+ start:7107 stop:7340 length:234 start_codon:yes stop_codon:yes gene_type:complete